jgi:hypothetical protein
VPWPFDWGAGRFEKGNSAGASVVSLKFVAQVAKSNRRSFDSVWPKNRPNSAQDDSAIMMRTLGTGHWSPKIFKAVFGTTEELAKKSDWRPKHLQRLKPDLVLMVFSARVNSCTEKKQNRKFNKKE